MKDKIMSDNGDGTYTELAMLANSDKERFKLIDPDNGQLKYTGKRNIIIRITRENGSIDNITLASGDKIEFDV